jgi:hypothetical protein
MSQDSLKILRLREKIQDKINIVNSHFSLVVINFDHTKLETIEEYQIHHDLIDRIVANLKR